MDSIVNTCSSTTLRTRRLSPTPVTQGTALSAAGTSPAAWAGSNQVEFTGLTAYAGGTAAGHGAGAHVSTVSNTVISNKVAFGARVMDLPGSVPRGAPV